MTNPPQCFQTKVAREHYHYSIDVKNALPPAIDAVDEVIHEFSSNAGVRSFPIPKKLFSWHQVQHNVQELYENLATKGIQLTTASINSLAKVDSALAALYDVLTKNNFQESLVVGRDKYKGVLQLSRRKVSP
jgi:hypothetical protein